jgi:hypothetical protein
LNDSSEGTRQVEQVSRELFRKTYLFNWKLLAAAVRVTYQRYGSEGVEVIEQGIWDLGHRLASEYMTEHGLRPGEGELSTLRGVMKHYREINPVLGHEAAGAVHPPESETGAARGFISDRIFQGRTLQSPAWEAWNWVFEQRALDELLPDRIIIRSYVIGIMNGLNPLVRDVQFVDNPPVDKGGVKGIPHGVPSANVFAMTDVASTALHVPEVENSFRRMKEYKTET